MTSARAKLTLEDHTFLCYKSFDMFTKKFAANIMNWREKLSQKLKPTFDCEPRSLHRL